MVIKGRKLIDDCASNIFLIPNSSFFVDIFISVGATLKGLSLQKNNFWTAKAKFFSLSVALANAMIEGKILVIVKTRHALLNFSSSVPDDYALAAREAFNNKREREIRDKHVSALLHFSAQD